MSKVSNITKELLISIALEEKERFSQYSQLCAQYQTPTDPMILARYHGKMEILQKLLQENYNLKI